MAETKEITVLSQQSLEDVALEHYGSVEGTYQLLLDNRKLLGDGFNSELHAGMKLRVRQEPVNEEMFEAIRKIGLHPASDITTGAQDNDEGDFNDDFDDSFDTPQE